MDKEEFNEIQSEALDNEVVCISSLYPPERAFNK